VILHDSRFHQVSCIQRRVLWHITALHACSIQFLRQAHLDTMALTRMCYTRVDDVCPSTTDSGTHCQVLASSILSLRPMSDLLLRVPGVPSSLSSSSSSISLMWCVFSFLSIFFSSLPCLSPKSSTAATKVQQYQQHIQNQLVSAVLMTNPVSASISSLSAFQYSAKCSSSLKTIQKYLRQARVQIQ
jgi:hypothetical protein